jgi:MtN3 and saliva related transmembrane protein
MSSFELLGFIAGSCTTAAFVPQVLRCWRTKNADGISRAMYLVFTAGLLLWIAYGLAIRSWPVVGFNAITFVLSASILVMKMRFAPARAVH